MIIEPSLPGGYVVFCDDVRHEVGGKVSYMGVYSGEITVYGDTPLNLGSFCVAASYLDTPPQEDKLVEFKIIKEGSTVETLHLSQVTIPAQPKELDLEEDDANGTRFVGVKILARFTPLLISEPCKIRVRAYVDGNEIRLGTIKVKIAPLDQYWPLMKVSSEEKPTAKG